MTTPALMELHDRLLAEKPDCAIHDAATCSICVAGSLEGAPVQTYTEEELRAAVEAAVGTIRTEMDALKASATAQETAAQIEARIVEATAPLEAKVTELQSQLDASVLEVQAEKARADSFEAKEAAAVEAATLAARKDERLAKVKEVANFPAAYLDANADRFVAMSDEDFEARLDEYRQIAAKATGTDGLPTTTALTATREGDTTKVGSAVRDIFALRQSGIDTRTL